MAISKTQNERPAIVALIDEVNATSATIGQQQQQIYQVANGIAAEVEARTNAVDGLTRSLGETNTNVDALDRAMDAVDDFIARFKIGETETITVPANDSYASSYVFDVPFTDGDGCMVILQVITDELSTLFEVALIDCTYSGFSYQITNSDADAHDVKLGFVAVRTNSD